MIFHVIVSSVFAATAAHASSYESLHVADRLQSLVNGLDDFEHVQNGVELARRRLVAVGGKEAIDAGFKGVGMAIDYLRNLRKDMVEEANKINKEIRQDRYDIEQITEENLLQFVKDVTTGTQNLLNAKIEAKVLLETMEEDLTMALSYVDRDLIKEDNPGASVDFLQEQFEIGIELVQFDLAILLENTSTQLTALKPMIASAKAKFADVQGQATTWSELVAARMSSSDWLESKKKKVRGIVYGGCVACVACNVMAPFCCGMCYGIGGAQVETEINAMVKNWERTQKSFKWSTNALKKTANRMEALVTDSANTYKAVVVASNGANRVAGKVARYPEQYWERIVIPLMKKYTAQVHEIVTTTM